MSKGSPISTWIPPADWYTQWWEPEELFRAVQCHNNVVPGEVLFNNPQLKPLHEAYVAALFSKIRGQGHTTQVKLSAEEFPDFILRLDNELHEFEITEADRPDRKRGKEYREAATNAMNGIKPELKLYDPDEEEVAALPAIAEAIKRKASKCYNPLPHLLIYVNFSLYRDLPLTDMQADELTHAWREKFASIWLLWGGNAVRCWPKPAKIVLKEMADSF